MEIIEALFLSFVFFILLFDGDSLSVLCSTNIPQMQLLDKKYTIKLKNSSVRKTSRRQFI